MGRRLQSRLKTRVEMDRVETPCPFFILTVQGHKYYVKVGDFAGRDTIQHK